MKQMITVNCQWIEGEDSLTK